MSTYLFVHDMVMLPDHEKHVIMVLSKYTKKAFYFVCSIATEGFNNFSRQSDQTIDIQQRSILMFSLRTIFFILYIMYYVSGVNLKIVVNFKKDCTNVVNIFFKQLKNGNKEICLVGFSSLPKFPSQLWILGDVFLAKFYTVFDFGYNTVSFGQLK